MPEQFNIYCDESCHLEKDKQQAMVLGAIWCPTEETHQLNQDLKSIKVSHGFSEDFELKWTKVSPAKIEYYLDVVSYFFENPNLHFRALIAPDKSLLRHEAFNQTHDDWYYKMYFDMLKSILDPSHHYHIYIDMKDTRGGRKVGELRKILSHNMYDFSMEIIGKIQIVRSHEIEILQLCDLLVGAISYVNRGLDTSTAKLRIINQIRERSGYRLDRSTLYREDKINLFRWRAREVGL